MNKAIKKEFLYFTDDEDLAFDEARKYWAQGEENVTVATVNKMLDPPNVLEKFVVLRVTEL